MGLAQGLVAAVLIAGCYRAREAPAPAAEPRAEPAAPCASETAKLAEWLALLASEGHQVLGLDPDTRLAVLADAAPTLVPEAPPIFVTRRLIVMHGHVVSEVSPRPALGALASELGAVLARAPGTPVILAIDDTTPWSVVAAVARTAEQSGVRSLELLFTAGTSKTTPPEPGLRGRRRTPELFSRCGPVDALMNRLAEADDRTRMLVDELPRAIEACGCEVELPAVRRWLWGLWGRDQLGMPMTTVSLAIAPGGAPLTMDPSTPWSAAHAAVVAAAQRGAPVSPR
jgi:hypothetical protein